MGLAVMDRLIQQLRNRIVSALHLELVRPGERLPSIRELSRDLDVDHRAVARAYHALRKEGLVEIRGRAGVFAAEQEGSAGDVPSEMVRWLANTLAEAWRRKLNGAALQQLLRRATDSVELTCVCLESTDDHLEAYADELKKVLPVRVVPVKLAPAAVRPVREEESEVRAAIRQADLVLTTAHHAAHVQPLAAAEGVPLVLASVEPVVLHRVDQLLEEGKLTLVVADPAFGDRIQAAYREQGRTIPATALIIARERERISALPTTRPVLITRAARRVLGDVQVGHLVAEAPTLSVDTIRQMAEVIIMRNLARPPPAAPARGGTKRSAR